MELRRKRSIFIFLAILLIFGAVLVLIVTIPNHVSLVDQCMIPEGCGPWTKERAIGNYAIALLMFIVAGLLFFKYLPLNKKNKKRGK